MEYFKNTEENKRLKILIGCLFWKMMFVRGMGHP